MEILSSKEYRNPFLAHIIQKFNDQKGIFFSILTAFCFATNSFCVKQVYLHTTINEHDLMYIRAFYGTFYFLILSIISKNFIFEVRKESLTILFLRMLFGFFGFMFVFYQYKILPLSIATVIFFTYPGFMSLSCYLLTNEKLSFYDYLGMIASFFGLCLLVLNDSSSTDQKEYNSWALFVPVIAAIFCAFADTYAKLVSRGHHFVIAPFYFSIGGLFASPLFLLPRVSNDFHGILNKEGLFFTFFVGVWSSAGQAFLTLALMYEKGGRYAIIQYLNAVFSIMYDIIFLGKNFTFYEIAGSIIIIGSNFTIAYLRYVNYIK